MFKWCSFDDNCWNSKADLVNWRWCSESIGQINSNKMIELVAVLWIATLLGVAITADGIVGHTAAASMLGRSAKINSTGPALAPRGALGKESPSLVTHALQNYATQLAIWSIHMLARLQQLFMQLFFLCLLCRKVFLTIIIYFIFLKCLWTQLLRLRDPLRLGALDRLPTLPTIKALIFLINWYAKHYSTKSYQ